MRASAATVDFETRSACDIKKAGSWRYSLDPTTEVLCLAFRLPHWPEGETGLWHPDFPALGLSVPASESPRILEMQQWVRDGFLLEAHNAWFERGIWKNILCPKHHWPSVDPYQWRCSAAKCAAHALPRKLEDAGKALKLKVLKDLVGHKAMLKASKPRKPRKAEREAWAKAQGEGSLFADGAPMPTLWHESADLFDRVFTYCQQDVLAEEAISELLPDLSQAESIIYSLDQIINERGFQIDMGAVTAALTLIERESKLLNRELAEVTHGKVKKATQRAQIKAFLESEGCYIDDTTAQTLDDLLARGAQSGLSAPARRSVEILRTLGRSSTAKYEKMQLQASPADARIRGGLLYHGASTGRWAGAGVQPHNFPKGSLKDFEMNEAWDVIQRMKRDEIVGRWGSVMEPLSQGLRGAITAAPGKTLYVADYASIEARGLLWAAGDTKALDVFREGKDIYLEMASAIYDRPITKADKQERQLGKAAVLGCGYQMGASKFVDTAASYGVTIDDEFSKRVVDAYRQKFWRVKKMWYAQEDAAVQAVGDRMGRAVRCGKFTWHVEGLFLYCTLPSGRRIAYPFPQLKPRETPWGDVKNVLTFMGINTYNKQWERQSTYGGSIVENLIQALCRDIMAEAMVRIEMSDIYEPILTVHDELIAEAVAGTGSVHEFQQLVAQCPTWATGMPIAAEGWEGFRYHK